MSKKVSGIILTALLIMTAFAFSGCQQENVVITNKLIIDEDFAGERVITCSFATSIAQNTTKRGEISQVVEKYCPQEIRTEKTATGDQLVYTFRFDFDSKEEYVEKLELILDKEVTVSFSTPSNLLAEGWRLFEDFDGTEIISFIAEGLLEENINMELDLQSNDNTVTFSGDEQKSRSGVLDVSTVKGSPVNNILIETTNYKNEIYDRVMTISFPQNVYAELGVALEELMQERISYTAEYATWKQQGNNMEFSVSYKSLDIDQLQEYTMMFLDCEETYCAYGDKNNSSTPLAEQLVFEEHLNTFSFVPKEGNALSISYQYSLPLKTTYGEGLKVVNGVWENAGDWIDGTYTFNSTDGSFTLRVPDGIQYNLKEIDIQVEILGDDQFVRLFDFIYDQESGHEARDYAYNFLMSNTDGRVEISKEIKDEGIACRITQKGRANELGSQLNSLFGGGNHLIYKKNVDNMSLVSSITFTDHINISYMLTDDNKNVLMTYTLKNSSDETIISFDGEGKKDSKSANIDKTNYKLLTMTLTGGVNDFTYRATVPNHLGNRIYLVVASVLVATAIFLIFTMIVRARRSK